MRSEEYNALLKDVMDSTIIPPKSKTVYIEEVNIGVCLCDHRAPDGQNGNTWSKAITACLNGEYFDILLDNGFTLRLSKGIIEQLEALRVLSALAK